MATCFQTAEQADEHERLKERMERDGWTLSEPVVVSLPPLVLHQQSFEQRIANSWCSGEPCEGEE